jgi:hypothetical protein
MEMQPYGAVIVSWDFSHGKDKTIVLVGKQNNGKVDVINAFQGQDAIDIYNKLTGKKGD